jgi:outer membrane protein
MKQILSSALLIGLLFVTSNLYAQEKRTITIQEAIDLALENNYQLKQAKNNLDLAEYTLKSEYADFLPSLSASFSGSRRTGQQFISDRFSEGLDPFVNITSQSISGNFSASIPIFNGFENIHTLRASEQSKISEEESYNRAKEQVIFSTAEAYLRVLLDMELLEIAKENLANSNQQLEQVQAQVEVGSRPTVDLYDQEALVASDELSLTQQENALKLSKTLLVRQLQIDPLGEYVFTIPEINPVANSERVQAYSLSELIDQALLNRSDLKSTRANIRVLELQYKMSKASLYPSVNASAGLSTSYSDQYSVAGTDVNFGDQFFDQRINRSMGFSVSIPLFQNWNRMTNIQSSQVQLKNAELNLDNSRLQVIQEVTQAYNDYTSYIKQLQASEKSMRASERAFETQQERYNVGSSSLIELSQAQSNYVSAQSNYTQATYNLIFQEKLLDYFLGKLSGDSVQF